MDQDTNEDAVTANGDGPEESEPTEAAELSPSSRELLLSFTETDEEEAPLDRAALARREPHLEPPA